MNNHTTESNPVTLRYSSDETARHIARIVDHLMHSGYLADKTSDPNSLKSIIDTITMTVEYDLDHLLKLPPVVPAPESPVEVLPYIEKQITAGYLWHCWNSTIHAAQILEGDVWHDIDSVKRLKLGDNQYFMLRYEVKTMEGMLFTFSRDEQFTIRIDDSSSVDNLASAEEPEYIEEEITVQEFHDTMKTTTASYQILSAESVWHDVHWTELLERAKDIANTEISCLYVCYGEDLSLRYNPADLIRVRRANPRWLPF